MRALILDANSAECFDVVEGLRRAGYTTVEVASIREARQALVREPFDLLVLDEKLPDGNGLAFCWEVRERLGASLLIIVHCPPSTPSRRAVGLQLGADDVLDKPGSPEELLARLEARLRRRGMAT